MDEQAPETPGDVEEEASVAVGWEGKDLETSS